MKHCDEVWGLWDADELVSVHLTDQAARDAREQHLERYLAFPAERDIISAVVEIRRTRLVDQPPPLVSPGRRLRGSDGGM
ncbi:hypothetical protein K8W59_19655 [Nocardioides rotundus]|uniref:hypothetical protein n=1 Tax=Nocardioides rotundus TaxID=1774216 RepID=UPI001CBE3F8D|nr:hypothetical protein [Nocardioides rotundus]UAL29907.1 hypothetical protein K8W59_19655 [Nocardioides rotundus]